MTQQVNQMPIPLVVTKRYEDQRVTSVMVTTRYSDHQGSKPRQKVMRLHKQWHRPISKRFIKPLSSVSRVTSIEVLSPTHGQRSQQQSRQITLRYILIVYYSTFVTAEEVRDRTSNGSGKYMGFVVIMPRQSDQSEAAPTIKVVPCKDR